MSSNSGVGSVNHNQEKDMKVTVTWQHARAVLGYAGYREAKAGYLPGCKVGKMWRVYHCCQGCWWYTESEYRY